MEFITTWVDQYGYYVLFFALMLELIALPLPGEVLMSYTGFLVFQGKLNWMESVLMAGMGSIIGMTISYWIGYKLGAPFFYKYGPRFHMGPDRFDKTSRWFGKYGNKLLIVAYFIPGIRHITGYFSGTTRISYPRYALYAYLGAFIWVSTFISLGKILGPQWEQFHSSVKKYLIIGSIIVGIILTIYYLYRNYKKQINDALFTALNRAIQIFHSLGRVRVLITGVGVIFLIFFILMIGLIQDYLSNEFELFDKIVMLLVQLIFQQEWSPWMKLFGALSSIKVLLPIIFITWVWILIKGRDKILETLFLLIAIVGGEILEEGLRLIFHNTFPSEQSLISIVVYGFAGFLIVRHVEKIWIRTIMFSTVFMIPILIGLNLLFFQVQNPSDIVAGYVFGGVWLTLNMVLLEVFRLLRGLQTKESVD
ncbi:VTT domain-containing protein [Microaerobacter geothermalis]|uniref:VTT domain-containing protein n=1 Tax=Microaerobacter geothermalis TaxID=674972 RepID=UPI001F387940|nr:VTT domain-containing protein [Microaerobacter geothermalis]MCF6093028.1 VTT domain-containing protein [Microaerobacter geothermalis]